MHVDARGDVIQNKPTTSWNFSGAIGSISHYLAFLFYSISLIGLGVAWFFDKQSGIVFSLAVVIVGVIGWASFLRERYRRHSDKRYADALHCLWEAVEQLHSLRSRNDLRPEEWKAQHTAITSHIAKAYSLLSGRRCRCCVKIVWPQDESNINVDTLCRDTPDSVAEKPFPVLYNSAFCTLMQDPEQKWFFGNDLPTLAKNGEYTNTRLQWQERYKSAIVWPLRTRNPEQIGVGDLWGFLCVDSKRANSFNKDVDFEFGSIIASLLCVHIAHLHEVNRIADVLVRSTEKPASGHAPA
ncbi:MAG TPA: hypothetical protein PLN21_02550 [Gemmatales bacterium]|nr:hypothetical protein [Gemmatales bacterium]